MKIGVYREGAQARAGALLAEFEKPLLRYAMFILGDSALAQAAVEQAFTGLPVTVRRGKKILDNPGVVLYRNVNRAAAALACRGAGTAATEGGVEVFPALNALSLRERQVVGLKILERKSAEEIGHIMETSEETVVALLNKSVKNIAVVFKQAGLL